MVPINSILIPSPYVAENHQFHNAMTLKSIGAAEIIEEKNLDGKALIDTVSAITENKEKLSQMGKNAKNSAINDANERIYKEICKLVSF